MKRRSLFVGVGAIAVLGGLGLGYRAFRGPVGAIGEATPVPEFTSLEASRWNGAPESLASAKGKVVFVEGWSPG